MASQTAPTRVSIVTVYYNRVEHVGASIQSLLDQTHPDIEIIIVDDGSTDGTWEALQAAARMPNVRLIQQRNQGFTAAINNGIRDSSGAYVAVHGSGDISYPERIAKQADILDRRDDVAVVGCVFDNSESHNAHFQKQLTDLDPDFYRQMLRHDPFTHGCIMYRRDLFDRVGGYREFFRFAQDRDFLLRLSDHGTYEIVPEVLYRRNKPANSVNNDFQKSLIQEYFADFAVQLAITRRRTSVDLLDKYGHASAFLRRPSRTLGRRLVNSGLRWRVTWDDAAGWHYLRAARDEDLSLRSRVLLIIGSLPSDSWLWRKIVKPGLSELLAFVAYRRSKEEKDLQKQKLEVAARQN
jgi:glycosyltransferase involved in cell wall biosynthesis